MSKQELEDKLNQLGKQISKLRWLNARTRMDVLRAQRVVLPHAMRQAEAATATALSSSRGTYCHDEASQALDELEAALSRCT